MIKLIAILVLTIGVYGFSFQSAHARLVKIDFSQVECCRILSDEYKSIFGVNMVDDLNQGFATYQAHEFLTVVNSASSSAMPTGISSMKFVFDGVANKVSFKIQSGTPFDATTSARAMNVRVNYLDNQGRLLASKNTDTCLKKSTSCTPKVFTYLNTTKKIKSVEIVPQESYYYSVDDMVIDTAWGWN